MPKFGTVEWWTEYQKLWDRETTNLLRGFSSTITWKIADKPELKPILLKIEDGVPTEVKYAEPNEESEYSLEAPTETWKAILEGKLDLRSAAMGKGGRMKFSGSLTKVVGFTKGFLKMVSLLTKVPTEW